MIAGVAYDSGATGVLAYTSADGVLRRVALDGPEVKDLAMGPEQGYKMAHSVHLVPSPDHKRFAMVGYAPVAIFASA